MRRRPAMLTFVALLATACTAAPEPPPETYTDVHELVRVALAGVREGRGAQLTTDAAIGGTHTSGRGEASFDNPHTAMAMELDFAGERLDLRVVAQELYVKVPDSVRADVGTDKPWLRVTPDGTDPFSQLLGASLDQLAEQNDPVRTLGQMDRAGTITASDTPQLDGRSTAHYRIDLDLAKLDGDLPAGLTADAVRQLRGRVDRLPLELWLDTRQRPVQVVVDFSPALKALGPADAEGRLTARYAGWGAPVSVPAPPPDQVGEAGG